MEHHDDRHPVTAVEVTQQAENVDLMGQIKVGRRFVEEEHVGVLGQGHGDPHSLALTSGQLVNRSSGQLDDSSAFQRRRHRLLIGGGPSSENSLVRSASARHQICDGDRRRSCRGLRQQPDDTGELPGRHSGELLTVQDDLTAAGADQPCHRP